MEPGKLRYEYRAWAEAFPDLPQPDDEPWVEETYLLPLGLVGLGIKIRGDALEIKELLTDRDGFQLWSPAARLAFPIPALTLERELMVRLAIGEPLRRKRYGPQEIMTDIVQARRNVIAATLKKRRRLFEVASCRAETAAVEVEGQRMMTAAAEHEDMDQLRRAVAEMKLDRYPNLSYPETLLQIVPRERAQG